MKSRLGRGLGRAKEIIVEWVNSFFMTAGTTRYRDLGLIPKILIYFAAIIVFAIGILLVVTAIIVSSSLLLISYLIYPFYWVFLTLCDSRIAWRFRRWLKRRNEKYKRK